MSSESPKLVPDPGRNLTSGEILGIMDRKDFTRPEDITEDVWNKTMGQVREALIALNLDIPVKNVKSYFETLCKDVDTAVRDRDSLDANLLQDAVVKCIRELIGMRIRIRFQLGNHKYFPQLIDLLKRKKGNVSLVEIKHEYGQTIVINMYELVRPFGKTDEQKRFAWDIINEFLSEQAGVPVKLRSKFADFVSSYGASIASDVAPEGASARIILPKIELPEGLSLDNVDTDRRKYLERMYYLKRCLRNAIDNIELSILEIRDMLDDLANASADDDLEKRRLLTDELQYLMAEKAKFEELLGIIDPSNVVPVQEGGVDVPSVGGTGSGVAGVEAGGATEAVTKKVLSDSPVREAPAIEVVEATPISTFEELRQIAKKPTAIYTVANNPKQAKLLSNIMNRNNGVAVGGGLEVLVKLASNKKDVELALPSDPTGKRAVIKTDEHFAQYNFFRGNPFAVV